MITTTILIALFVFCVFALPRFVSSMNTKYEHAPVGKLSLNEIEYGWYGEDCLEICHSYPGHASTYIEHGWHDAQNLIEDFLRYSRSDGRDKRHRYIAFMRFRWGGVEGGVYCFFYVELRRGVMPNVRELVRQRSANDKSMTNCFM